MRKSVTAVARSERFRQQLVVPTSCLAYQPSATAGMADDKLLPFDLLAVRRKKLTVDFDGGDQSSNGGLLLLRWRWGQSSRRPPHNLNRRPHGWSSSLVTGLRSGPPSA
jgi:hypothetical protein